MKKSKFKYKMEVLFEDDYIIIVNKPSGLLTIPDRYLPQLVNVFDLLKKTRAEVFVVHRIDKATSGLLIFAKTAEVHKSLSIAFEKRTINKYYLALTEGVIAKDEGQIDLPLLSIGKGKKMIVSKEGKPSLSDYKVEERFRNFTLIKIKISTGRMHQIRAHCKAIGHPLVADDKYGRSDEFYLSSIKKKYNRGADQERPLLSRTALHAWKLNFVHPETGQTMDFEAPIPKDLNAVIKQLKKWNSKIS